MSAIESALGRVHARPHEGSIASPDILTRGLRVCQSVILSLGDLTRRAAHESHESLKPQRSSSTGSLLLDPITGKCVPLFSRSEILEDATIDYDHRAIIPDVKKYKPAFMKQP